MREGLSDEEGIQNTIDALKQVLPLAEKKKVNICLEPLNTRVDVEMKGHPGYQCDKVEWAVEVCEKLGSPRMKILFDIYHTQVMQGDVIVRIQKYKDLIGHYHTAGVPGRNDIGDDARDQLSAHHARHPGHRLQGLRRPGIHPDGRRQNRGAAAGRATVRCLKFAWRPCVGSAPTVATA